MMIPSGSNHYRRAGGFTLVELLLAVTLMSILLGLTYSGLHAAARSADRGETMLVEGGEVRAAHQFVRRQLNQMLPLPFAIANDGDDTRVIFSGDARHMQYVAPMPGYLGSGGPQVQLLELVNDGGDEVLQFSHALLQGFEQENLLERDPVVLLTGVYTAGFEYLGRDDKGETSDWVASWEQQDTLPVAVRLQLEFSDDKHLQWPDLVAGVRIDEQAVMGGAGRGTYKQTIRDLIRSKGQDKS